MKIENRTNLTDVPRYTRALVALCYDQATNESGVFAPTVVFTSYTHLSNRVCIYGATFRDIAIRKENKYHSKEFNCNAIVLFTYIMIMSTKYHTDSDNDDMMRLWNRDN